jgi:PKD repeat protein
MKTKIIIFSAFFLCFLATLPVKPAFAQPNLPPVASFTFSVSDLTADFDGSDSTDDDGTIASYSWDFGDSTPNGSGVSPSHTYAAAGTYTVVLTVTDDDGDTVMTMAILVPTLNPSR